jgi:hypothetical protein
MSLVATINTIEVPHLCFDFTGRSGSEIPFWHSFSLTLYNMSYFFFGCCWVTDVFISYWLHLGLSTTKLRQDAFLLHSYQNLKQPCQCYKGILLFFTNQIELSLRVGWFQIVTCRRIVRFSIGYSK